MTGLFRNDRKPTGQFSIRHFLAIFSIVLISATTLGCAEPPNKGDTLTSILGGEHNLRRMAEKTEKNFEAHGSFFLLMGDIHAKSEEKIVVKFAWQMNDGIYAIGSLPLEKIRVRLSEKAASPTISFGFEPGYYPCFGNHNIEMIFQELVHYAVITCKESDWPINVQLPLNKNQ